MEVIKSELARELVAQNHCLIAGCTGSGKSVLVNKLIYELCTKNLNEASFVIVDLKRVSLLKWEYMPHCMGYARDIDQAQTIIHMISNAMDARFKAMEKKRIDKYIGGDVYLIIDEAADLLNSEQKKDKHIANAILADLIHIGRLGRAAKVHMIFCTQKASRATIPSDIQANCNALVGLHCRSAMESRQIIGYNGAELLPRYGECLVVTPDYMQPKKMPVVMLEDRRATELQNYWNESMTWKQRRSIKKRHIDFK